MKMLVSKENKNGRHMRVLSEDFQFTVMVNAYEALLLTKTSTSLP